MRKLLSCLLAIGCMTAHTPSSDIDTQYWICKNEDSIYHNKLCNEDCYEPGDPHKFCWLLEKDMCTKGLVPNKYIESCKVFTGQYHDQNN